MENFFKKTKELTLNHNVKEPFRVLDIMFDTKLTFEKLICSISSAGAQKIGTFRNLFRSFWDQGALLKPFDSVKE